MSKILIKLLITSIIFSISLFAKEDFSVKISYYLTQENLSIEQIKKVNDFKLSSGENFGFTNKYCFLKIEVVNDSKDEIKKYFKFEYPYIDHILVYKDSNETKRYGQLEKFNREFLSLQNVAFYIKVAPKTDKVIYIRIESTLPIKTKIKVFDESEYLKTIIFYKQLFAFVYGIIVVMIIYNLIIYFNLKEKSYLYYVLFHSVGLFGIFSFSGLGFEYIWAEYPIVNFHTYGVVVNLLSIFDYMLIIYFLDTQKYLPKLTKILKSLAIFSLLLAISSLFFNFNNLYELNMIFTESVIFSIMVFMLIKYKMSITKYILIAKLSLFLGVIVLTLSEFGIITNSFIIDNAYILGIIIELILMSFVLSYKYKDEKFRHKLEKQKRIQTEEMLIAKQKLSTLGEMFNSVVHQWRQPLSQINSIVFSIESDYHFKKLDEVKLEDKLNRVESLTNYLSHTIDDFKNFSIENKKVEKFKIKTLIDETLSIINFSIKSKHIDIDVKYSSENIYISSNRNELSQVLMIILNNAKDALIESKTKEPKIIINIFEDTKNIYIKISNNGGEISKEIIDKIFEPYFSTKDKKYSTGIGLYIAKVILDKLKSNISVTNVNGWVKFSINFTKIS